MKMRNIFDPNEARRLSFGLFFWAFLFVEPVHSASDRTVFTMKSGDTLTFERTDDFWNRTLTLRGKGGKEEVEIWSGRKSDATFLYSRKLKEDLYAGCQIVSAELSGRVLLVLFKLKVYPAKKEYLTPPLNDKYLMEKDWEGEDYLIRSFIRGSDGRWKNHLSIFPNTFWGDAVNQQVIGAEIDDENSYLVHYKGTWRAVQGHVRIDPTEYKVANPVGETVRKLNYNSQIGLLFATDPRTGRQSYITESCWWLGFDEFSRTRDAETALYPVLKSYVEKLRNANVQPVSYVYLPRAGVIALPAEKDPKAGGK